MLVTTIGVDEKKSGRLLAKSPGQAIATLDLLGNNFQLTWCYYRSGIRKRRQFIVILKHKSWFRMSFVIENYLRTCDHENHPGFSKFQPIVKPR